MENFREDLRNIMIELIDKIGLDKMMDDSIAELNPEANTVADVLAVFVMKVTEAMIGKENANRTISEMDNDPESGKAILRYIEEHYDVTIDIPEEDEETEPTEPPVLKLVE